MTKTPFLLAVTAISGFALMATSSSAGPLAGSLAFGSAPLPTLDNGLVQNVQAWSCQEKRRDMTLEQLRFCDGYYDYDDYEDYGPGYGYPAYDYGYPGYGLGVVPFLSFGFDGGRRHHHRHHGGGWD